MEENVFIGLKSLGVFLSDIRKIFATQKKVTGATSSTDGESGLVPQPLAGDEKKCLMGDGTYGYPDMLTVSTDSTYEELEEV